MRSVSIARLAAMLSVSGAAACLFGCSSGPPNHTPPPPASRIQEIQNNPHMTPAQKTEAIQLMQAHQSMGRQRGKIVERGAAGH